VWNIPYNINSTDTFQDLYPLVNMATIDSNNIIFTKYAPLPPLLLTITPNPTNQSSINLNWAYSNTATSFTIYRSQSSISSLQSLTPIATVSGTSYNNTNLSNGTYYYVIVANNPYGASEISNCQSVTVAIPPSNSNTPPDNNLILIITISVLSVVGIGIIGIFVFRKRQQAKK
jgi:hypothetical protein